MTQPYVIEGSPGSLPLRIHAREARAPSDLGMWLCDRAEWIQERLVEHGALLFRGFDVSSPRDFEQIARAIDSDLKNEYLGTSPRNALTDYVFSASELPGFYPIPQHCEMSFLKTPPRRVFFCCFVAPTANSGETPLADFRKVWRDLNPEVRARFEQRGIRIIRNYSGPRSSSRFDLWKLKRWDEMFLTTDRAVVEEKCRAEGFEAQWTKGDNLRLISFQTAARDHPQTGERVWYNHSQVFHLSAAPGEYRRIYGLRPTLRNWMFLQFARVMSRVARLKRTEDQSLHCTYADGTEIPDADMEHVRDVIWKHLVVIPWQRGDVIAIDNHSVAHGRLPYRGPREIAVCWA